MTLAANQPYFFPYFPYWQLIAAADTFLICDDYAFIRHQWIPRNRILLGGEPHYFRIELEHQSCNRLISNILLMPVPADKKLRALEMAYSKAPFFADGYALARRVLLFPERQLHLFLANSIREVCDYLGITTQLMFSSSLNGGHLRKEERIFHYCHSLGAERYINAIGGQALYDKAEFAREGIELCFLCSEMQPYPQFGGPFVPDLSVLDAIMFNSRESLMERLGQYRLL